MLVKERALIFMDNIFNKYPRYLYVCDDDCNSLLYNLVVYGFRPSKIYRLAKEAFKGTYSDEVIKGWMKKFYSRFFSQQFKRSCMPDGPKVGPVSLSPRGGYRIPSDACVKDYLKEVNEL